MRNLDPMIDSTISKQSADRGRLWEVSTDLLGILIMPVADVLRELGYIVIEAQDGPSGLTMMRSALHIDLLITDIGLPRGMTGGQVAEAARALRPDIKVLFITGFAENAATSHGHVDAAGSVLTKPFAMEALASRVEALLV